MALVGGHRRRGIELLRAHAGADHVQAVERRCVTAINDGAPSSIGTTSVSQTSADELGISLGGLAFPHRLYQFALAHSGLATGSSRRRARHAHGAKATTDGNRCSAKGPKGRNGFFESSYR